jgi:hypothetical protein
MIRHFLQKLVPFKVLVWAESSDDPNQGPTRVVSSLLEGDVLSSLIKVPDSEVSSDRHAVVLDIDYPAALIPSDTAGHFHLFLDVPGGIKHETYMVLLQQLASAGVIEKGYAAASWDRGHSDVRLPWVSKADTPATPVPQPLPAPKTFEDLF